MNMRMVMPMLAGIAFVMGLSVEAQAERRLALVIGNSAYDIQPLENPANDARLMAETLEKVGFEVTHLEDLGEREFVRTVISFGRELRAAGEDSVGLFYYAGHAIQADGENYLVPVDAELRDKLDLRVQTVDASTVMASLESAGNRLNMVFLDACRNNPFKGLSRSGTRGLAKLDAPTGTLIAYSTAPGDVAVDGNGRNSPYTRALARAIMEPGLPVEQALKKVRIDVMERTGKQQTPWESSSLTGDFFFVEEKPEPAPQVASTTPPAQDQSAEIEFWKAAAQLNTEQAYRDYLANFPEGLFAGLANARLQGMEANRNKAAQKASREAETVFFQAAQQTDTVESYESYLVRYPEGLFAPIAKQRIAALETLKTASRSTSATAGPDDEAVLWNNVKDGTTKAEFQAYLDAYPEGRFASVARAKIAAIEERRRVASLPGAENIGEPSPFDGRWRMVIEGDKPNGSGRVQPFCQWGKSPESGSQEFEIVNGKANFTLTGNAYTSLDIAVAADGGVLHTDIHWKDNVWARYEAKPSDGFYEGEAEMKEECTLTMKLELLEKR